MKFRIRFTTLPPVTVEIDVSMVEAFAMHYCEERGLNSAAGTGPQPLHIERIPDTPRCPRCGNEELQLSHNTLSAYCETCDEWFDEKAPEAADPAPEPMTCPECESASVTTTWENQVVPYGDEGDEVSTRVPVRHCLRCSTMWLDYESEAIRDKAVSEAMLRRRH